jgi:DNA-binding transcriptional ArsR family regulator
MMLMNLPLCADRGQPSRYRREVVVQKSLDTDLVSFNLPLVSTYRDRQLDAVGDPTRRAILSRLRKGPASVGKLASSFPVSRPAISQHLKVLKDADLVKDRAEGTRRVYELNPAAFASLREYFDEFWGVALISFKKRVDNTSRRSDAGHG